MTTTFSSGKIKAMMPTLINVSDELQNVIGEAADGKKCINYRDMASRFMCEIIGEIAFGLKCRFYVMFSVTVSFEETFFEE